MSMSVKAASSSSTSRNPSARQNRRATSRGMSVRAATSAWVRRCPAGTSMRSTTSRSSTSSSTARSISSSVHPSSSSRVAHPGQGLDRGRCSRRLSSTGSAGRAATAHPRSAPALWRCHHRCLHWPCGPPRRASRPSRGLGLGPRAVLVPIKAFHEAKRRLDHALTASERADLARSMAAQVVEAAASPTRRRGLRRQRRRRLGPPARGALVVWEPGRGLNGAVEAGVDHLRDAGVAHVTVSHADLPRARGLAAVGGHPGITLVPDRYGNGTNVIAVPTDAGFRFSYGPGILRPAPGRGRTARDGRRGSSTFPTWPGTSTSPADMVPAVAARSSVTEGPRRRPGHPGADPPVSGLPDRRPARHATVTVDLPAPAVALAVGAHPDDIEFGAGATLAKWAASGCSVHLLVLTDGSKGAGTRTRTSAPGGGQRRRECRAAAAVHRRWYDRATTDGDRVLLPRLRRRRAGERRPTTDGKWPG